MWHLNKCMHYVWSGWKGALRQISSLLDLKPNFYSLLEIFKIIVKKTKTYQRNSNLFLFYFLIIWGLFFVSYWKSGFPPLLLAAHETRCLTFHVFLSLETMLWKLLFDSRMLRSKESESLWALAATFHTFHFP